ncbi:hypothetical protein LRS06_05855 [Hymenobacter sp. J193]|uniref:hypothetical protein n=1 Tax=Hymenobacter sp. J193 TaxID=2898429 RepID=UPI00215111DD|nr:hypothetical protein [Hymenobacter sp. J193]MCR5887310.1 hypothetical protein [Hymenobacter sp. J193]
MSLYENDWEDFDEETKGAFAKATPVLICFGIVLATALTLTFLYSSRQQDERFIARSISAVVARKYLREQKQAYQTIDLLCQDEKIYFPGSRRYYDSLQLGDSLYKPAGSVYFFHVKYQAGKRTLRKLYND